MVAQQRHRMIIEMMEKDGIVYTSDLTSRFGVSAETIRKDLDYLERTGRLQRVHGGAIPSDQKRVADIPDYVSFQIRSAQNLIEKKAITEQALSYIRENQVIALDYGSTSQMMALAMKSRFQSLTVITNSIMNAMILADCPYYTVILIGGILDKEEYALYDDSLSQLGRYHIDTFFMSATGIDAHAGCTDQRFGEARIQIAMCQAATKTILIADSSKIGRSSLVRICGISDIDTLITDTGIPEEQRRSIEEQGVSIVIV